MPSFGFEDFGLGDGQFGGDFQQPDWRRQMALPLLGGSSGGFGAPGNIDFAGIPPRQAAPPGIAELLASIPAAPKTIDPAARQRRRDRKKRLADRGGGHGGPGGSGGSGASGGGPGGGGI